MTNRKPFPDRWLIKRLRVKYMTEGIDVMTKDELLTLINHQHELIRDLEKEIKKLAPQGIEIKSWQEKENKRKRPVSVSVNLLTKSLGSWPSNQKKLG